MLGPAVPILTMQVRGILARWTDDSITVGELATEIVRLWGTGFLGSVRWWPGAA